MFDVAFWEHDHTDLSELVQIVQAFDSSGAAQLRTLRSSAVIKVLLTKHARKMVLKLLIHRIIAGCGFKWYYNICIILTR